MFILVSTPSSPFSKHGHKLLLVSPVIEGLLGGYSTLQSGTSAYLSDCTSSGSRAYIFSRFAGVVYLGFSIGPVIGGWLIRHPISWIGGSSIPGRQSVTSVFWVAVCFSFINFLLITFVFPESLNKEKRERAMIAYKKSGALGGKKGKTRERALTLSSGDPGSSSSDEEDNIEEVTRPRQEERESGVRSGGAGIISHFLSPLAVFLPVMVLDPSGLGKRRDWSLTLLAGGLYGHMLSNVSAFCELSRFDW
jgi:MFS family permease